MIKRIALVAVVLAAASGAGYGSLPHEFTAYAAVAAAALLRAWEAVEANPVPVLIALGTFLLTVGYHTAKGKSLRESLAAAATRVTVVAAPAKETAECDSPVVERAKARATRAQLLADQIGLQNRYRKLPEEVTRAEKEACYTEQALADAGRALAGKREAHEAAVAKLEALRAERAETADELAEIELELERLAELV